MDRRKFLKVGALFCAPAIVKSVMPIWVPPNAGKITVSRSITFPNHGTETYRYFVVNNAIHDLEKDVFKLMLLNVDGSPLPKVSIDLEVETDRGENIKVGDQISIKVPILQV